MATYADELFSKVISRHFPGAAERRVAGVVRDLICAVRDAVLYDGGIAFRGVFTVTKSYSLSVKTKGGKKPSYGLRVETRADMRRMLNAEDIESYNPDSGAS